MAEETCWCGLQKAATCVRCSKPACAVHYYTAVWYQNGPDGGWKGQGEKGNYDLTIEQDRGYTYSVAYADGGPGCTTCRGQAGNEAVQAVIDTVIQFTETGDPSHLDYIAEHLDALAEGHKLQLGQYLYQRIGPSMEVVHAEFRAGPLVTKRAGLFSKPYQVSSGTATATEISRTPAAWMRRARIAFTEDGLILHGKENNILLDARIVVLPGTPITGRHVQPPTDNAWGQPDRRAPSYYEVTGLATVVQAPQVIYGKEVALPDVLRQIKAELGTPRR